MIITEDSPPYIELIKTKENGKMATKAEVARTDNSKLGRAVLNNRASQNKTNTEPVSAPVAVKKTTVKKNTSKKS